MVHERFLCRPKSTKTTRQKHETRADLIKATAEYEAILILNPNGDPTMAVEDRPISDKRNLIDLEAKARVYANVSHLDNLEESECKP